MSDGKHPSMDTQSPSHEKVNFLLDPATNATALRARSEIFSGYQAGKLGSIVGMGGTGKSWFALQLALDVADPDGNLLNLGTAATGPVVYLGGEDSQDDINDRLYWLVQRIPPAIRLRLDKNLKICPLLGTFLNLGSYESMHESITTDLETIIRKIKGARLLIIDPLSQFHRLEENSNNQMAVLMGNLQCIAKETGAAVLFIHHASKAAARDGLGDFPTASRGASVLMNSVRWSANLAKMTEDEAKKHGIDQNNRNLYLSFRVTKQNHGAPQSERWYKRHEGGVLLPAVLTKTLAKKRGNDARQPREPALS